MQINNDDFEFEENLFEEEEGPRVPHFQQFKSAKPTSLLQTGPSQSSEANQVPGKRWENLYQLSEKMKQIKELRAKEHEEQIKKDDKECTFKPQIQPFGKKAKEEKFASIAGNQNAGDFYERKKEWKERQDDKLKEMQEKEIDRESEKCTFKPNIEGKHKIYKIPAEPEQNSTTKKFLERQEKARQLNEEKKQALSFRKEYSPFDKKMPGGKNKKPQAKINDEFVLESLLSRPFSEAVLNLHSLLNQIESRP